MILSDVMMPKLNGFDFCRQLKADERFRHIPVVLVTALNSRQDLIKGLDAGADEFLSKPVSGGELRARVRSMLRIKQQHDELKGAMQLREDMTRLLVHDLRNPVASILVLLDLMEGAGLTPVALQDLSRARGEAYTVARLLDEMLLIARMEGERLKPHPRPVELVSFVKGVCERGWLLQRLGQREIGVICETSQVQIEYDPELLSRTLENLLSNAVKYSPDGSRIEVVLDAARLEVRDQGVGVADKNRQRIFQKFEVVKNPKVNQTGLGLYLCRLVAEAHNGTLSVEPNEPRGSRFILDFCKEKTT